MESSESRFKLPKWIGGASPVTYILAIVLSLSVAGPTYYYSSGLSSAPAVVPQPPTLGCFPVVAPTLRYGFALDTFQVLEKHIANGEVLSDMLLEQGLSYPEVEQLVRNMKGIFKVNQLRAGSSYTILTKDSTGRASYLVYEPSIYQYYVFDLATDQLKVAKTERPVTHELRTASGEITSSLWNAMTDNGLSYNLTDKMEDALQWSVDFHHLQQGDEFKLVYEQEIIDGAEAGIGLVRAAYYKTGDKESRVIYFEDAAGSDHHKSGYYTPEGRPMAAGFLKAPVKYARISSYYNLNRLHPILKRRRPHYGTDYAAPYGTPIIAVGSGTVSKASYTKGNGYFVKLRHDDTYETQYLHMQKFAAGIRPGTKVMQGDVIGYVGATGLATGPHVCFRFWKNGQQVNHLQLNLPPAQPLSADKMPLFIQQRDQYLPLLENAHLATAKKTKVVGAP